MIENAVRLPSLTLRCRRSTWELIAKLCGEPPAPPTDLGDGVIEVVLPNMYAIRLLATTRRRKGRAPYGEPELGRLNGLLGAWVDQFDPAAPERSLSPLVLDDVGETSAEG